MKQTCPPLPDTVALTQEGIVIIEQTLLPAEEKLVTLHTVAQLYDAICRLAVRGAPAIGVSAAMGMYLSARIHAEKCTDFATFLQAYTKDEQLLHSARPTAVNLSWALAQMRRCCLANASLPLPQLVEVLHQKCLQLRDNDIAVCHAIGENGLQVLHPGDGLLTHCNAGALAAVRYGTATAPIYLGHARGYDFHVYVDETRPLLQGARLTAFELARAGISVTLECDAMSASLLQTGNVSAVLVGCDRVAANGDFANKIGTLPLALAAKHFGIPFYVCAPLSTVDPSCPDGKHIPIEQRKAAEVTEQFFRHRSTAQNVQVYNPAFDVTDAALVTGFITEVGIARAPFCDTLATMRKKAQAAAFLC